MNIINIIVPHLPESVVDATVAAWHKKIGDNVQRNEILVEIETDKIMLEVPAQESGILEYISEKEGSRVISGQVLGQLRIIQDKQHEIFENIQNKSNKLVNFNINKQKAENINFLSPVIRKILLENNLQASDIIGSGIEGKITKKDIEKYLEQKKNLITKTSSYTQDNNNINKRTTTRVPMTSLRKKIAERLLQVTCNTAMLTTFNEVNMEPIMNLRKKHGVNFEKNHNAKLGFMSFYVKAVLESLKKFPKINAYIDDEEIVYYNYFDISIAISTPRGLVTPVLKNVDQMHMADIEVSIKNLSQRSRENKLKLEELHGGNFTITNGGVFGSLMSTPIINPPQSAILGMHAIKNRPVADNFGKIVVLPMMYLALSYDHRLIDGEEAIKFLLTIKEILEDPIRLLLKI